MRDSEILSRKDTSGKSYVTKRQAKTAWPLDLRYACRGLTPALKGNYGLRMCRNSPLIGHVVDVTG